ncbi:hypothetical protein [Modestobacter sp. VKM Ac-2984]|uniref:hypothetical protein n=1 Tax=Modestobacter sp. VKM Ac-2984 TaxID=3004138 RepID=UPI0022AAEB0F|nr:hypothetical protein [Modestobacter sp. VKM Ac-2984]MCZ2814915.1 hypothetical protein [Modestobacter sp. VKM Ac-2984]
MSIVVRIWLWPSSFMTTRGCTFSLSSSVAAVCRPSCSRTRRVPAVGLGEDQVFVVPLGAGQHSLAELGGLLRVQCGHQGQRQGERALAPAGLRLS